MSRTAHPSSGACARVVLGLAAAAVAWVVVLAQLASTLHFALISHEVCAIHGELVHRATAVGEHGVHHATGSAALPGRGDVDDEHCPLLGRPHDELALLAAPRPEIAPASLAFETAGAAGVVIAPTRALLLLAAPKQSPPA